MAVPTLADVDGEGSVEIVVSLKDEEDMVESVLVFNGKAWPHNQRLTLAQGDSVHWRFVNLAAIDEMSDAVAHAVITYAFDTSTVTGDGFGKPVTPPGQSVDGAPGGAMDDSGGGLHPEHDHDEAVA